MNLADIWGASDKPEPIKPIKPAPPVHAPPSHTGRVGYVLNFIRSEVTRGVGLLDLEIRLNVTEGILEQFRMGETALISENMSLHLYMIARRFKQFLEVAEFVQTVDRNIEVSSDDLRGVIAKLGITPLELGTFRRGSYWESKNDSRMEEVFRNYKEFK